MVLPTLRQKPEPIETEEAYEVASSIRNPQPARTWGGEILRQATHHPLECLLVEKYHVEGARLQRSDKLKTRVLPLRDKDCHKAVMGSY